MAQNRLKNLKTKLPFAVIETTQFFAGLRTRCKPPFSGIYPTFKDAPSGTGYDDSHWAEKCRAAVLRSKSRIGHLMPESDSISKALLPAIVSTLNRKQISILDFGGAAGLDFANLLAQTNNAFDIKYHVVDVASACNIGREVWKNDARISFSEDMPPLSEKFDIVYSYSALQYVSDYKKLLKKFSDYEPAAMLFCKHPMHEGPAFVRCQKGINTAQWVFDIDEFKNTLSQFGYRLAMRGWGETSYNVDNYKPPYKAARTANLLFIRG